MSVITMPMKGKLLLTAVSIVNWIAGCASFRTERKSVAAVRSGTRAKVLSTYLLLAFQRSEICRLRSQATKRPWKENRSCNTTSFHK